MEKLTRGMVVATKNGQRRTNAIILKVELPAVHLITDFGNRIQLTEDEFHQSYEVSTNWLNAVDMGYPLDSVRERLTRQIVLLSAALEEEE